jgi:hypothetical protein
MKQITLQVEESKFQVFLSFLKSLDNVQVSEDTIIPEAQKSEVAARLKQLDSGTLNTRLWEEAEKDIFKK